MSSVGPTVTRAALGLLVAAATTARAGVALAQDGWALDRYEAPPAGDAFALSEHPRYAPSWGASFGLTVEYAALPLVVSVAYVGQLPQARGVVSAMTVAHAGASLSFWGRVGVHLVAPVSLYQNGSATTEGRVALAPASGVTFGDLRAGVRVRVAGDPSRDAFSLHLGVWAWLPTGSPSGNTGDGAARVEPRAVIAGRARWFRWSVSAGWQLRAARDRENLGLGDELRVSASLGLLFLGERLQVGPEAYVATTLRDLPGGRVSGVFTDSQWGLEAMLTGRVRASDAVSVAFGAGVGVNPGYGVPTARALASVDYTWERVGASVAATPPADQDADGVLDADDRCPLVPQGARPDLARRGCPARESAAVGVPPSAPPDGDGDGVPDDEDLCPAVAQGLFPDGARRGCPTADRDRDSVPDAADRCPDVPGAPAEDPAQNGCRGDVLVRDGRIVTLEPLYFHANRALLQGRSFPVLRRVAEVLRATPQIRRVSCEGHTDRRGDPGYNVQLSRRRMEFVRSWLVAQGVAPERLEAHGYGASRPIAPNTTAEGRARNRRVEFVILDPPSMASRTSAPTEPAAPRARPRRPAGRRWRRR